MGAPKLDDAFVNMMPEVATKGTLQELQDQLPADVQSYFLDFQNTKEIDRSFYPMLHQFKTRLERDQISLTSINVNSSLKKQLSSDGVTRIFNLEEERKESPAKSGEKKTINVEFITPFIKATTEILKVQANVESTSGKPRIKEKDENTLYDIIGLISLVSDVFEGSIALCFKKDVFLKICEGMLGETFDEIDDDIEDAAGELLNIIYGVAKAELNNEKNYKLEKAIPTVVRGPGVRIKQAVGPTIILPFETPVGTFQIEIEAVNH